MPRQPPAAAVAACRVLRSEGLRLSLRGGQVLPAWNLERATKRTLELWWEGVPSEVRGEDGLNSAPSKPMACARVLRC